MLVTQKRFRTWREYRWNRWFSSYGVAYPVSDSKGLAPLGLLEGGTVSKLIKAGDPISLESVELPENLINELRKKQES